MSFGSNRTRNNCLFNLKKRYDIKQIQKMQEAEDHQFVHYQNQLLKHKEQQRIAAQKSNSVNNEPSNKEKNNEVLTLNQKILDKVQQSTPTKYTTISSLRCKFIAERRSKNNQQRCNKQRSHRLSN